MRLITPVKCSLCTNYVPDQRRRVWGAGGALAPPNIETRGAGPLQY